MIDEVNTGLKPKRNTFFNQEKFIKEILYTSKQIVKNTEFENIGLTNRNIMFFLNCITENLSSVSMLGTRNFSVSLLGKINSIIDYYEKMILQFENKDKTPKMSKYKIDYIKTAIKNNAIILEKDKKRYTNFLNADDDKTFIENLRLIYCSLIENNYFETVSDELYDNLVTPIFSEEKLDRISILTNEYISLLIDYIGISIFEIKRLIRNAYREFFNTKKQNIFLNLFVKFTESYNKENKYILFIKMDKEFDDKLISSLRQSGNDNYIIYSKSGFSKVINDYNINDKKILNKIMEKYVNNSTDNKYFLSAVFESKDIWHAIKSFRQKTIQPFIGSMLYAGIKVNTNSSYIVIECKNNKKFINEYNYFDDIFKPISQHRINYSYVFKRYIIENKNNDINRVIDEAVQLLPYYKTSESILTKFTNTWFALETLFRNASDTISKSLEDYASYLVADRMLSGYVYVTALQIKNVYTGFQKESNNFVENIFINYEKSNLNDCDYISWKVKRVISIANNYDKQFTQSFIEARELLMNAYILRNKQFHGTKDSQLENVAGYLYDIVNDTISFYIDYLDVYKEQNTTLDSLFNVVKNINIIKSALLKEQTNNIDKISIIYDSIRKI